MSIAGAMRSQERQIRRVLARSSGEIFRAAARPRMITGASASTATTPTVIHSETGWSKAWVGAKRRARVAGVMGLGLQCDIGAGRGLRSTREITRRGSGRDLAELAGNP